MLTQLFAVGFYHFLLEIVPRLIIARRYSPAAPVLVPSDGDRIHAFVKAILELLGYNDSRLMRCVLQCMESAWRAGTENARARVTLFHFRDV